MTLKKSTETAHESGEAGQSKADRVARLLEVSHAKKEANKLRIREAMTLLERARKPITVAAVAREAGVSRQTLYASPFAAEVQELARRTAGLKERSAVAALPSEAAWRRRVQDLQDEVRDLKMKLAQSEARVRSLLVEVAS